MTKSKKLWLFSGLSVLLALILCFYYAFPFFQRSKTQINVRAIDLDSEKLREYEDFLENFFNEFEESNLIMDEDRNIIEFVGTRTFEESIPDAEEEGWSYMGTEARIRYQFYYCANTNKFFLAVSDPNLPDVREVVRGVPFMEGGELDILFLIDNEPVLLSELKDRGIVDNCGWFSRAMKNIAKIAVGVAVVAAVVAVAVVAAPAVVAAATTVGTALAVSGGTVAFGSVAAAAVSAAAAAGAAAMATTAFAVAITTAATALSIAIIADVNAALANISFSRMDERIEAAMEELRKRRPNDTIIFRWGSHTYYNLTPDYDDYRENTGLSFTIEVPHKKCVLTTLELVNETAELRAIVDHAPHCRIDPVLGDMADWADTKETADTDPHPYSVILYRLTIEV